MSLIVIPLSNPGRPDEDPLAEALLELVTVSAAEPVGTDRDKCVHATEPLRLMLPHECGLAESLHGRGNRCVRTTEPKAVSDQAREDALDANLLDVLQEAFRHRNRVMRVTQDKPPFRQPIIVIAPVAFMPEEVAADDERAPAATMAALAQLWQRIDRVLERLAGGGIASSVELARASYRIVPWLFAEPVLDLAGCDPLFQGPSGLGQPHLLPIIHGDVAAGRTQLPFEGYGQARLVGEMLALHALSANLDPFDSALKLEGCGTDRRVVLRVVSSMFEHPHRDLVRGRVLLSIAGPDADSGLVPRPGTFDRLTARCSQDVPESITAAVEDIAKVVEASVVEDDGFDFEPASARGPLPFRLFPWLPRKGGGDDPVRSLPTRPVRTVALPSQHGDVRFSSIIPSAPAVVSLSRTRQADRLHSRVLAGLTALTGRFLQDLVAKGILDARKKVFEETSQLERQVKASLGTDHAGKESDSKGLSQPVRAIGRVLAGLARITQTLAVQGDDAWQKAAEDERILASKKGKVRQGAWDDAVEGEVRKDAKALRDPWVEEEERLIQRGTRLPNPRSSMLLTVSVGVAAFFFTLLVFWFSGALRGTPGFVKWVAATVAGGLGAWMVEAWNRWKIHRDEEEWRDFADRMRQESNGLARRLVRVVNARVRSVKRAATWNLLRAVEAARGRFITEIAGLAGLIDDELANRRLVAHLREKRDEKHPPDDCGRFTLKDHAASSAVKFDVKAFHSQLQDILSAALNFSQMPSWVPVAEYETLIDRHVQEALRDDDEAMKHDSRLKEDALALLRRAKGFATDVRLFPPVSEDARLDARGFAIVGSDVWDRCDTTFLDQKETNEPVAFRRESEASAATRVFPSERAVMVHLQWICVTPKAGVRSVTGSRG